MGRFLMFSEILSVRYTAGHVSPPLEYTHKLGTFFLEAKIGAENFGVFLSKENLGNVQNILFIWYIYLNDSLVSTLSSVFF